MPIVDYTRQMGLLNPNEPKNQPRILIIGAGTIGSWTTLCLTKMGLKNITVVDFDIIEPHNSPNQLYSPEDAGKIKVAQLKEEMEYLSGVTITAVNGKFEVPRIESTDILISAVDTMAVRKLIFEAFTMSSASLFIDGRVGGNVMKIYALHKTSLEMGEYAKTLHSDDLSFIANEEVRAASELSCTTRGVADSGFICAGIISAHVRRHIVSGVVSFETIVDVLNQFYMVQSLSPEEMS